MMTSPKPMEALPETVPASPKSRLAIPLSKIGEKPACFLIPGLGGHVLAFHTLGKELSSQWNVYGLLHPAFDGESHPDIEAVADRFIKEIKQVQPKGPYYLAGYSMGGLIGLEISNRLKSMGEVVNLVLLDVRILDLARRKPFYRRWPLSFLLRIKMAWMTYKKDPKLTNPHRNRMVQLSLGEESTKPLPQKVEMAIAEGRKQLDGYQLHQLPVSATLIRCEELLWWDKLRDWLPDYGWSNYINVTQTLYTPGDHLDMIRIKENMPTLAQQLTYAFNQEHP